MTKIISWPKRPDTTGEAGGKGTAIRRIWRVAVFACLVGAAGLLVFSLVEWTVTDTLRPLFLKSNVWLSVAALAGIFSEHLLEMLQRRGGTWFGQFMGSVSYASFVLLAALLVSQVI